MANASSDSGNRALVGRYRFLSDVLGDLRCRPKAEARSELLAVGKDLLREEWAEFLADGRAPQAGLPGLDSPDGFTPELFGGLLDALDGFCGASSSAGERWLGWDPASREIRDRIPTNARSPHPVLVIGKRGTGKGQLTRAIHAERGRGKESYFALSCSALPDGVVESQLFGHVKGAFTGADSSRSGLIAEALKVSGTLVLDDLGEFPPSVQAKLLQVLEDGTYVPVGADRAREIGARGTPRLKICATTQPGALGKIRPDLRDRIATFVEVIPPLRDRKLDLLMFAELLAQENVMDPGAAKPLHETALQALLAYDWPGNVRQLQNVVRRAAALAGRPGVIRAEEMLEAIRQEKEIEVMVRGEGSGLRSEVDERRFKTLRQVVDDHTDAVVEHTDGNISQAARILGIARSTLRSRLNARQAS